MKQLILALLFSLAAQAPAHANGSSIRGGGKGIACRNARGALLSVELLDLWEAKKFYGRGLKESRQPVAKQVEEAVARIRNINNFLPSMTSIPNLLPEEKAVAGVWRLAQPFLLEQSPQIRRLRGVALTPTDDSFEAIRPQQPGCEVEQIVVYQDRTGQEAEILLNQDLFDKLSPTHQAALVVHEALYAYLRIFEDPDSIRARRIVGYVFAGLQFPSLNQTLPATYTACFIEKPEESDRVPYLFFYQGAGESLQVVRNHDLRFLPLLSYFPAPVDVGIVQSLDRATEEHVLKNLFSERLCDTPYMKEPGHVISGILSMPGTGPADYDHANSVSFACRANGTRVLEMMQGEVIEPNGASRTRALYCEVKRNGGK